MSLLGKILAVLNVIAAVAFLSLAAMVWDKRQVWNHAVLQHELAIYGLPLDAGPATPDRPAELTADNLTSTALRDAFKRAGNLPEVVVRTQLEEVERKQKEVIDRLRSQGDEAARRKEVGDILLNLAATAAEREQRLRQLGDPSVRTDTLVDELDGRFRDALRRTTADNLPRDPEEHRRAVAALLYNLSPDPAWHQRVLIVVGLPAYGREADVQAAALQDMIARQRLLQATERTEFETLYARLIQNRIELLDRQVKDLDEVKKVQEALKLKHQGVVDARTSVRNGLMVQRDQAQNELKKVQDQQDALQRQVFKAQRDLATAADDNLELERDIRSLEQGR
jgi:hypothetical protein